MHLPFRTVERGQPLRLVVTLYGTLLLQCFSALELTGRISSISQVFLSDTMVLVLLYVLGEALDEKTILLRSNEALGNAAVELLNLCGLRVSLLHTRTKGRHQSNDFSGM
jgi:hypothetical protein